MNIRKRLRLEQLHLMGNPSGQGLLEYMVLLMLIVVVIFVALQGIGETLETEYYEPFCSAVTNAGR